MSYAPLSSATNNVPQCALALFGASPGTVTFMHLIFSIIIPYMQPNQGL